MNHIYPKRTDDEEFRDWAARLPWWKPNVILGSRAGITVRLLRRCLKLWGRK